MHLSPNKIYHLNCVDGLQQLAPKSVHTCVSSPPYYALRDYGLEPTKWPAITYTIFGFTVRVKAMSCCLGLEPTPEAYIGHMVYIYRLVREALRDDGTVWVNIGDSYAANQKTRSDEQACRKSKLNGCKASQIACKNQQKKIYPGIKAKDMLGIPWMLAFALRADGWYLRQDIIWSKQNGMPESCTDRCTKSHEYLFLLSKSKKYYFDHLSIATELAESTRNDHRIKEETYTENRPESSFPGERQNRGNGMLKPTMRTPRPGIDTLGGNQGSGDIPAFNMKIQTFKRENSKYSEPLLNQSNAQHRPDRPDPVVNGLANKRSVWSTATAAFKEAHYAVFPEELIVDCIKSGCPIDGLVLDMFMGRGTTAVVSVKLNRNFIGFEQSEKSIRIAKRYMHKKLGLFNPSDHATPKPPPSDAGLKKSTPAPGFKNGITDDMVNQVIKQMEGENAG